MRTRWEEDAAVEQDHRRKFSILPLALGMAVPVAFIAGAAITSYVSMSSAPAETQSEVAAKGTVPGLNGRLWTVEEQMRCAVEVKRAQADTADLHQQLENFQSQLILITREKEEAERRAETALAEKNAAEAKVATVLASNVADMSGGMRSSGDGTNGPALAAGETSTAPALVPAQVLAQVPTTNPVPEPVPTPAVESVTAAISPSDVQSEPAVVNASTDVVAAEISPNATDAVDQDTPAQPIAPALNPRSASSVSEAMAKAPGLTDLAPSALQDLEARLVRGECVSSSLASAFNRHAPVVPLRDLVRNLNSDC